MRVSRSRAPSTTTNSAVAEPSPTDSASGVLSRKESGPAVNSTPSDTSSTHGTIVP